MLKKRKIHMRTTMVKVKNDWGYRSLCGLKMLRQYNTRAYQDEVYTTSDRWVSCARCLEIMISKQEKKLEYLKWAHKDQTNLRALGM